MSNSTKSTNSNTLSDRLPNPEKIDDKITSRRAKKLLEEALEIKLRYDKDKDRLEEITDELTTIARGFELPGIKHGQIALAYFGERSNKYLDKSLLLEHGVSPETIAASYRDGKQFSDSRLMLIAPPK